MGGMNSEITENTTQLLFESAKFMRDNIRKTARSLGQNTDASSHYEKGIAEYTVEIGMARAQMRIRDRLGTGGLVRASSGAVKEGLAASEIVEKKRAFEMKIVTDYTGIGKIQYILGQENMTVLDSVYTDKVEFSVLVPVAEYDGDVYKRQVRQYP